MCETHRKRARRYGDPRLRRCLTKAELTPYLNEVRRVLRRGKREKIETVLVRLQQRVADVARDELAERRSSMFPGQSWLLNALEEIERVVADVSPVESGVLIAACFLARSRDPDRWPTDRAFTFDLVRAWRKQTDVASASYWCSTRQRAIKTHRELRPATTTAIAEMLVETYKTFVARITRAADYVQQEPVETKTLLAEGLSHIPE